MSLDNEQKVARYRNLLIMLAVEITNAKARASDLKQAAAKESHPGKKAGLRTLLHCSNRNTQTLEKLLSRNRAALRDFFGTANVETIAKAKIILHKL